MTRSSLLFLVLAVVAMLAALYCVSGYAMTGSFAEASGDPAAYHDQALTWAGGAFVGGAAALGFALMAWRRLTKH